MSKGPYILDYVENDLLPFVEVEWEGQDLTGYDIKLHFRKPNGLRVTKTAIIDVANVGGAGTAVFHFEWTAGDLLPGESDAEIEVFDASLNNETWKGLILRVAEEIS